MERMEFFDDDALDMYDIPPSYGVDERMKMWTQDERERGQEAPFTQLGVASSSSRCPLVLIGLEAICNAVGAGPRTVKRWVDVDGFPARRCSDGVYRADPRSVQRWFSSN